MFKLPVVYIDFNDTPRNEDLYFHMMVPEYVDLQFDPIAAGDFATFITEAMKSGDGGRVYALFKLLVSRSYGRRTPDGSGFSKNPEWTKEFFNSPAWEQTFLWLTERDKDGKNRNADTFWSGITPPSFLEAAGNEPTEDKKPVDTKDITTMSREELLAMVQQG